VLGTVGKRVLAKEFAKTVTAIEARESSDLTESRSVRQESALAAA